MFSIESENWYAGKIHSYCSRDLRTKNVSILSQSFQGEVFIIYCNDGNAGNKIDTEQFSRFVLA